MSYSELKECERIACHFIATYGDESYSRLEKYYSQGMYTELQYVTIHGFLKSREEV